MAVPLLVAVAWLLVAVLLVSVAAVVVAAAVIAMVAVASVAAVAGLRVVAAVAALVSKVLLVLEFVKLAKVLAGGRNQTNEGAQGQSSNDLSAWWWVHFGLVSAIRLILYLFSSLKILTMNLFILLMVVVVVVVVFE